MEIGTREEKLLTVQEVAQILKVPPFGCTVATALSEMREPVRTAQQVLGHSSPQTTLTFYVQSVEESQRRAVAKLEEVMPTTCAPVAPQMHPSGEQASAK